MFGLETEYAMFGLAAGGEPINRVVLMSGLLKELRVHRKCVPYRGESDLFLANGARFYFDAGEHPELTTPECTNPWDVVRYVLAGERMLDEEFGRVVAANPAIRQVVLHKTNVDYAGASAGTWGCHESYLFTGRQPVMHHQIVPHLVSRLVFTGSGGFDSTSRGLAFMLSPRVAHLVHVISCDSTSERGIVNSRDESLCGDERYHRLHLLCGESQRSELAAWLKVGTTALVVAMIEAGRRPTQAVQPASPLDAMRAFAGDPTCRVEVPMQSGGSAGALAIQRHLLEQAEANLGAPFMPPWAGAVCSRWREVLTQLEREPASMGTALDWAIKLGLFREHARRRGIAWESLPAWTHVIDELTRALDVADAPEDRRRVEQILAPDSPVREKVEALTPYLESHGLAWDQLRPVVNLRNELFEIDVRYGQVGDGLFAELDAGGLLAHHVPGVDNIEHAMEEPPGSGRARLRGQVVRRLAGHPRCRCSWDTIWASDRIMNLSDPFESEERWRPAEGMTPEDARELRIPF